MKVIGKITMWLLVFFFIHVPLTIVSLGTWPFIYILIRQAKKRPASIFRVAEGMEKKLKEEGYL